MALRLRRRRTLPGGAMSTVAAPVAPTSRTSAAGNCVHVVGGVEAAAAHSRFGGVLRLWCIQSEE